MGCEGFLDAKPEQRLVVPTTLEDVGALLDNTVVFNVQTAIPYLASDEFRISDAGYQALATPYERGVYLWEEDPFGGQPVADWSRLYQQVFYANVALEALEKTGQTIQTNPTDQTDQTNLNEANRLNGAALFLRAYAYHQLLQVFAMPYSLTGGNSEVLGIVLRDRADINVNPQRASLQASYDRVVSDLRTAVELLPDVSDPKTRPSKAAALGLLSRVQLEMGDYAGGAASAEAALQGHGEGLDFNSLDLGLSRPFSAFNAEMVFYSSLLSNGFMRSAETFVDSVVMDSYGPEDLRRQAYFMERPGGRFTFSKFLTGTNQFFGGISVGELYLNAAEGYYRAGDEEKARELLDRLLIRRMEAGSFEPVNLEGQSLLDRIIGERRKELIGRGLRWSDLRRLNQFGDSRTVIQKTVSGKTYELVPGSPRYAFPIPDEELARSGIRQNPR